MKIMYYIFLCTRAGMSIFGPFFKKVKKFDNTRNENDIFKVVQWPPMYLQGEKLSN
jgi:hypothetical protein